jgi:hypothetical protein
VLLFDGVVHGELVAKLLAEAEELLDRHALGSFLGLACGVEYVPCLAKVVMEIVHVLSHFIVPAKFGGCEFG